MKIATWNINSIRTRLPHVLDWLKQNQPDILALQETKAPDEKFPQLEIEAAGYRVIFSGQKSYNGVATIYRGDAKDVMTNLLDDEDAQRRVLGILFGDVYVLNVYVPNGVNVGSDKYQYKLAWLEKLKLTVREQLKQTSKFIVLGDFNIAPEDRDVYDPASWAGHVLVSEPERKKYREIISEGLQDAFRLFDETSGGYSWWDYRHHAFMRNMGLRLDLILLSETLAQLCQRCYVDRTPRALEKPSDHTPVMAEFSQNQP